MTSSTSINQQPPNLSQPSQAQLQAEKYRQCGNNQYKLSNFALAIQFYTKAIDFNPDEPSYYNNRAACHLYLRQYQQTLADSNKALSIDPSSAKGYRRRALACMNLALFDEAILSFREYLKCGRDEPIERDLEGTIIAQGNYEKAVNCLQNGQYGEALKLILLVENRSDNVRVLKIKCEIEGRLGDTQAASITLKKIEGGISKGEKLFLKGIIEMNSLGIGRAKKYLSEALREDPNNQKIEQLLQNIEQGQIRYSQALEIVKLKLFQTAIKQFKVALLAQISNRLFNSLMCYHLAKCYEQLEQKQHVLLYLTKSIQLNPLNFNSYMMRIKFFVANRDYEKGIADYKKVEDIDTKTNYRVKIKELEELIRKRKDQNINYYQLLEVSKDSTTEQIKKVYRKKTLKYYSSKPNSKQQQIAFGNIAKAYQVLINNQAREHYDKYESKKEQQQIDIKMFLETSGYKKTTFQKKFKDMFQSMQE